MKVTSPSRDSILAQERTVRIPSVFAVPTLPWLLRLYRFAYKPYRNRLHRNCIRVPTRALHRMLHTVTPPSYSVLLYSSRRGVRPLQFSIKNLQYHSVYLPQHIPIYEPEVSGLLTLLADRITCFWDVGANWGHHTLFLLAQHSFRGRIEAFEPNRAIAAELQQHLKHAGEDERASCHPFGLHSSCGHGTLKLPDGIHSGLAKFIANHPSGNAERQRGDAIELPAPDLIKVDAEGSEANVLLGCINLLAKTRPIVIVELWPASPQCPRIVRLLQKLDYSLHFPAFTLTNYGWNSAQIVPNSPIRRASCTSALSLKRSH